MVAVRSAGTDSTSPRRSTRIAIVNDDMPFLVDSIASVLAAHQIDIHRLLHPVLAVRRDGEGRLTEVRWTATPGERRESMIYIEGDRVDAKLLARWRPT
jgi:glutamate dehydrogenase